ncbi:MAG: hypothetical protein U0T36_11750 [Saprospiraceae bacterium]
MRLGFFQYATKWMNANANLDLIEQECLSKSWYGGFDGATRDVFNWVHHESQGNTTT